MGLELDRSARVYVAGHRGLAGAAIWRRLDAAGFENLHGATSSELDLRDRTATFTYLHAVRPDVVIVAAARVGGILANSSWPAEFLSDNLRIQLNVMDAARDLGVRRLVFLGSSCVYPKFAPQPIREDSLLTGPLETTNDAYAIAKIAGILQVQAVRRQDDRHWISLMPTNLYGPGDNFDPLASHVLPALIRRFHDARAEGAPRVVLWGTGTPRREFLHVDDLADAVVFLLEHYDDAAPINVGVGRDITIREVAVLVAEVIGYDGEIVQDPTKPDGTPRKVLDVSRLTDLGWTAAVGLRDGIAQTYEWFLAHQATARL